MIDYFCIFANAAAAQADPTVGAFWNSSASAWDTSTVFPGVSVSTPAALVNGISSISGFWIIVSQQVSNPALDAICVMKLDRELGAVNGAFVLVATITGSNRTNLNFAPVPHGSRYPRPLGK